MNSQFDSSYGSSFGLPGGSNNRSNHRAGHAMGHRSENEIPLSKPDIGRREEELVLEVLRSDRLSMGPMLERFEQAVADRTGCSYGVGVNSGTSGLHLVIRALGLGPGDEVITTPFSFVASANCILFEGATPVFVDVCPKSLNMDPGLVERAITPRTKAILAVEALGSPDHMDAYAKIAARHEITLIEDCCEALGTVYKGRPCGGFGRVGVFGFYPNKQITTGEGGMIVTNDERLADLCRSMRNQGRATEWDHAHGRPAQKLELGHEHDDSDGTPSGALDGGTENKTESGVESTARRTSKGGAGNRGSWLHHARLGYNYRMSEIQAALGVAQMERLDEFILKRERIAEGYLSRLMGNPHLVMPNVDPLVSTMSWFVFVVRLESSYSPEDRDRIIAGLRANEMGASNYFPCIHLQPYFSDVVGARMPSPGSLPIAETVAGRTIALPFSTQMRSMDIELVCQTFGVDARESERHSVLIFGCRALRSAIRGCLSVALWSIVVAAHAAWTN
jgi:perosamine synthetase